MYSCFSTFLVFKSTFSREPQKKFTCIGGTVEVFDLPHTVVMFVVCLFCFRLMVYLYSFLHPCMLVQRFHFHLNKVIFIFLLVLFSVDVS